MLYEYMADYSGTCVKATFLGNEMLEACRADTSSNKVNFGLMRRGLGVFTFYLNGVGTLWFTGAEKHTPKLDNYRLVINRVELPDRKADPKGKLSAHGECSVKEDAVGITTIACEARTASGSIEFSLISKIPPEIEDCSEFE